MRFAIRNLSVHGYSNGLTLWCYKGRPGEDIENMCSANYFAEASDMFTVMDTIILSSSSGGRLVMVVESDMDHVVVVPFS